MAFLELRHVHKSFVGPQGRRPVLRDLNLTIEAGEFVAVETRSLTDKDHLCGNEATFYPPLTETTHAMPAVAMTDQYQGQGLDASWTFHDKRSAFVGTFAR